MTREEKIREARRLRALGWTAPQIGRELGVSDSTVRNWYLGHDCVECGAPIEGSNAKKATRCDACNHVWQATSRTWTREAVILAIQEWARKHGRPPQAFDWLHTDPRGRYPCFGSVYKTKNHSNAPFATWNDAIRAAGFVPADRGRYPRRGEVGLTPVSRRALAALRDSPRPLQLSEIKAAARCAFNSEWNVMQTLIRRGLAVRVGWGRYVAAEHVAERIAA